VGLCLIGIAALSTALRIVLVMRVHAPTVFSDELGYNKLAQSIGESGKIALFNKQGLSYAPLYPALLSPIYALGASPHTAYDWMKIVNAVLISLSVFPTYKIARFALSRRPSLLVAVLAALTPLMTYSSFTMSENLAYPLCLVAIWAMLVAVRAPRPRNDALLLAGIVIATAARVQLIVLVPAALTAILLAAVFERVPGESVVRSIVQRVRRHALLFGAVAAVLVFAGIGALAGQAIFSAFGRYANVGRSGLPSPWEFLDLAIRHLAGLDLALGAAPFVGALVAAFAFARSGFRGNARVYAAVAVSVTTWLLVEVAWDAAVFDSPTGDVPRIHERFLIYVIPFFLVALLATVRVAAAITPRVYLCAAAFAGLLPVVIPFHTVINSTISVDSFGLEPYARVVAGEVIPARHATLTAILIAATFSLIYVVVRERMRTIAVLVLLAFLLIGAAARTRIEDGADVGRSALPTHVDWVDRAVPAGGVVLITGPGDPLSALETAYFNKSIARLYSVCRNAFGPDFGEQQVTIDNADRLRDSSGFVTAGYAVVPAGLVVRGRVVASSSAEVLVAPPDGPLSLPLGDRPVRCT
jgi:hypothetical protein